MRAVRPAGANLTSCGTSDNDSDHAPSSGRSDSVSNVSDLSELCFTSAEPDPQLLQSSNIPALDDHKACDNGPQEADESSHSKCNSDSTVSPTSLTLKGTNCLDKEILPNAADLKGLTSTINLHDSSPLYTVTVEKNAKNLDSFDCMKAAAAQSTEATGRLTRAMARRQAIHTQHDHALRPRTTRSVKCF
ncbi:hypothetical protein FE257_008473 [Aspergillus nanangensis]|uniref:Uncharacterized protein n=1 Tax=Aspergillus nanangensis TaxID=2582783 RepID=A0AAD4CMZ3_ASPNN|nr:hypothetical protein FE257_008473 [Aspergillus nanangensis]